MAEGKKVWGQMSPWTRLQIMGLDSNEADLRATASHIMHTCFQAALQEWARKSNTSRFGGLEDRNVLLHPSLTVWGLRKRGSCVIPHRQHRWGYRARTESGMGWIHTGQGQGHRMSRLHGLGRILLGTHAPSTNTQWLSAVEHIKARAQQMRIKALPPRTPAPLQQGCRGVCQLCHGAGFLNASATAHRRSFQCWWSWRVRGAPTFGSYKPAPGASSHNNPRRTISPNCVPKRRG